MSESDFLQSRSTLSASYLSIDQQALKETKKDNRFLVPLIEAKNFVRDAEVFLATRGLVTEAVADAKVVGVAATVAKTVLPPLPGVLLQWASKSSNQTIPEFVSQTKEVADTFYTRIDAFSVSSPNATERLGYHEQNFRDFLNARSKIDEIFEEKSDGIANRHLSLSEMWNYGEDQQDFYYLELYHIQALIALDTAESKYLEESEQRISPSPAGWN
jgi:hypothetical protein